MGLFSKTPKPRAELHILVQGLDIKHDLAAEMWEFEYKGDSFFGSGPRFSVPSLQELDQCLSVIACLKSEMLERIEKNFETDKERSKMLTGLSYIISIEEFVSDQRFEVTWSGDDYWGDLQVDFVIEDGKIVDEGGEIE